MPSEIQFYPVDIYYHIISNKAIIYLYGKTTDGSQICVMDSNFLPYFYVIPKKGVDVVDKLNKIKVEKNDQVSKVITTEVVVRKFHNKKVDVIKVYVSLPRDVPIIRDVVKKWEIIEGCFEYDIEFVKRYLIDRNIVPLTLTTVSGSFEEKGMKVKTFIANKIEQKDSDTLENFKILAFDIETYNAPGEGIDFDKNPILMIAFYGSNYKKVITYKKFKTSLKYVEFVESEKELLVAVQNVLEEYKPDIITGYNSDGFDLPYIDTRAKKHRVKLNLGLDKSLLNIKGRRFQSASIVGISHIDLYRFVRRNFGSSMKTDTFKLDAVANELLGEKKIEVELTELSEAWDSGQGLEIFCKYNLHDTKLTYKLCERLLPNIIELVKMLGMTMFEVSRMGFSMLVETYLMRRASNNAMIVPNKPGHNEILSRRQLTYRGAFVFEPKPGLYDKLVVFDFRSLYPTIISSHNIDHDTLNCECCVSSAKKIPSEKNNYWYCMKKKGFISSMIEEIIMHRTRIKDMMKKKSSPLLEARQYGLKILANSFYGYLGFYAARWYSIEAARSTTALGRYYIHKVIDSAKTEGFKVLYSDTDSIFLLLDKNTQKDAHEFCNTINRDLPGLMELEYEGYYPSGIFVSLKEKGAGAKKKYALLAEDGTLKIKGFETVRRNWSKISKDVQQHVLEIILKEHNKKKAFEYVKGVITSLRARKVLNSEVIIHTQLTKNIAEYNSISPHVAIAKRMEAQKKDVGPGTIIKYIVGIGKGRIGDRAHIPSDIKQGGYDPEYYIANQVVPAVSSIFAVLGYSKEELLESSGQKKLEGFFE